MYMGRFDYSYQNDNILFICGSAHVKCSMTGQGQDDLFI